MFNQLKSGYTTDYIYNCWFGIASCVFFHLDQSLVSAQISCLVVFGRLEEAWSMFQLSANENIIPRRGALLQLLDSLVEKHDVAKVFKLLTICREKEHMVPACTAKKILLSATDKGRGSEWVDVVWGILETYRSSPQSLEKNLACKFAEWFRRYLTYTCICWNFCLLF